MNGVRIEEKTISGIFGREPPKDETWLVDQFDHILPDS